MNKQIKSLSIIFPVYKDTKTIETMINKCQNLILRHNLDSEVIVVNDCCPDGSGEIADEVAKKFNNVTVLHHEHNKGYGMALKTGFNASTKNWILQTDGDCQYDIDDFDKMLKIIHNYDCLITFRYKKIYQSYRIFISWFYNKLIRFFFNTRFRDISTGLRLINKVALSDVTLDSNSSFIGAELAIRLMLKGYQVGEMGITTYPRKFGKSGIVTIKSILHTIKDLIALYKKPFKTQV